METKILRINRDESDLNFVIEFPKGRTIADIIDVIFLVKELDASPLTPNLLQKLYIENDIILSGNDQVAVKFYVADYDNMTIGVLYRAALFCKWTDNVDYDENVERLFDFQLEQNFHNNN